MDVLISRQAAIEALMAWEEDSVWDEECLKHRGEPYWVAPSDVIEKLPSAQPEQRWIPVSERLPEEVGRYLVTVDFFGQTFALINTWEEGGWIPSNDDVIAWMPLPEPYKGGE